MEDGFSMKVNFGSSPIKKDEWLEFEKDLRIDSQKLPDDSSGTHEFNKICVLLYCYPNDDKYGRRYEFDFGVTRMDECLVYCIDVSSSSPSDITTSDTVQIQPLEPVIRFNMDALGYVPYVILGSRLYMFGITVDAGLCGLDVCYYDMKTALSSLQTEFLTKKSPLVKVPPMKSVKLETTAVVIGDSKICVFG